jgi:hypothetical protein
LQEELNTQTSQVKKKKRANHGKAESFLKLILIVEKNKEQFKFEEHYWGFFDDESIHSFFFSLERI